MIWDICTTSKRVDSALQAYVVGCFVSVVSLMLNAAGGRQQLYQRFSASGFHVDDIGPILVLGLPFAIWLLRTRPGPWRIVNGLYLPLAVWAITLSGTRTAMIASFPVVLFGLTELRRLRARLAAGRTRRSAWEWSSPAASCRRPRSPASGLPNRRSPRGTSTGAWTSGAPGSPPSRNGRGSDSARGPSPPQSAPAGRRTAPT